MERCGSKLSGGEMKKVKVKNGIPSEKEGDGSTQDYSTASDEELEPEPVEKLNLELKSQRKEHALLRLLVSCANSYCSQFHPIALLKKQVLQCVESINLWSDLPLVPNEQEVTGLMIELCRKPVRILFCPRSVLEVTVVLRQIGLQCHQVSCQVISTCEARYKQWISKSLRSRQRQNYLRLRRSIKCLSPVLQLILILITLELINIHTVCDKNPTEYQQYLKFLKMILQYTENLVTYTNPEKNKWEETLELTHKALIKIRAFSEKQQMLMQLAK
ncbi:UNVERIFIED_CONTAM: hypothetical protein K2H54_060000 [Gekko kuhli]